MISNLFVPTHLQSELSDNHFHGFIATALIQLPGYVYVILTLELPLFGRKRSMLGFLLLSGTCLVLVPFIPGGPAKVATSMVGRFAANCSFTILNLYTTELYPTVVRYGCLLCQAYFFQPLSGILSIWICRKLELF